MDNAVIQAVIEKGSFFALLAGVLWWLFTIYLPKRDEDHKLQMAQLQQTFRESLDKVVGSFQKNTEGINTRLDIIEKDIGKIKKK